MNFEGIAQARQRVTDFRHRVGKTLREKMQPAVAVAELALVVPSLFGLALLKTGLTIPDDVTVLAIHDLDHPGQTYLFNSSTREVVVPDGERRSVVVDIPGLQGVGTTSRQRTIFMTDVVSGEADEAGSKFKFRKKGQTGEKNLEVNLTTGERKDVSKWGKVFPIRHINNQ